MPVRSYCTIKNKIVKLCSLHIMLLLLGTETETVVSFHGMIYISQILDFIALAFSIFIFFITHEKQSKNDGLKENRL